jgi:glycosyltransferase involved in cell wall biosynthesis
MKHRIFFDVSGLVQWYAYLSQPSGIQRVMESVLGLPEIAGRDDVEFIARALGSDRFYRIPPRAIMGLKEPNVRRESIAQLRRMFADSMRLAKPARLMKELRSIHLPYIAAGWARLGWMWQAYNLGRLSVRSQSLEATTTPMEGDVLVGLGDFWCHRGHVESLVELKQRTGINIVQMVHDLVPVYQPQWTHPHYGREFVSQLAMLAPHVDRWLTNSHYVANQLRTFLNSRELPAAAIDILPMGWSTAVRPLSCVSNSDNAILEKYDLKRGCYILHVGTVEPRKNVGAIIEALTRLRASTGTKILPCVLVGRDGWRSESVHRQLKSSGDAGHIFRWLKSVDNTELAVLYRHARFTVVPSHDEGWGLAVQESLAHGTPCIASAAGGLTEAGLDLAYYVSVRCSGELEEAIKTYLMDDEAVGRARRLIRQRFENQSYLPTWRDSAMLVLRVANSALT